MIDDDPIGFSFTFETRHIRVNAMAPESIRQIPEPNRLVKAILELEAALLEGALHQQSNGWGKCPTDVNN